MSYFSLHMVSKPLFRWTFSDFSGRLLRSHQLVMQSISATHLMTASHSNHINSPCLFLVGPLSIPSTHHVINSNNTSSGHVSLQSHQLVVQSIPTTHLATVSHSGHINSPCSQFQQHILWSCLTPVTSTRCVVNSNDPKSTHQIKYMSNKLGALGLTTCVTHLTYMLQLERDY